MYEVSIATDVRALHVMPDMEGPEGELHAHDYRLEVIVARDDLDGRGMVIDLDVLDAALRAAADKVRDADLEVIRPPGAQAVTVEIFARWVHDELARTVHAAGGDVLTVRVWESPVAYGAYQHTVT
jgi:6-pyruvoyltetrahydropterin/6-carboxytetrahydropterin synthase